MTRSTKDNIILLRRAGYTQARLAEILGISQPMVCRWESGQVPASADVALKIAHLADSTVDAKSLTEKAA